ncbi:hypothetical protein [Jidongwangia harbinensis]|uniref:hypothetical protein n=1 Tax=Jidongwangia harbinensis TaxID=2878561 RepID=UPI001CD9C6AB|nr:hypothetical protein [Jidongwangia harbinensis]MCA2216601.1 hypothetical protein [Jidongwangia harbinensis]
MTAAGWIALAITVFGAFSYAAASILQAVAARRSSGTVQTLRHPLYLLGIGCDVLAWVGSMIALRELAVYLVESVLAGSLAVTVVAARFVLRSRLRRRDVVAVVVSIGALATLALSAGPQDSVPTSDGLRLWFCGAAVAAVVTAWGAARVAPPGIIAALAGLCLGGAALVGRALPMPPAGDWTVTALAVLTEPLVAALLTFAATGMLLYAHALQHGQVGPVTAVHWTAEVVAPSAVALLILGDTVRPGWELAAAVAGLVTVGAAVVLATAPATHATARPGEIAPATTRPALPSAARPAPVRRTERVIWWGPPPIWIPPKRTVETLTGRPLRQLTADGPHAVPPGWTGPQPADAVPAELAPAPPRPARQLLPEPDAAVRLPLRYTP